ncbi:N-acetylglucosamine-6-phosphate deacetylase [Planococcus sp. CAU13]|uniref:N-acetylglucosamine-6-phosphate deacetylase n=1 Tax=Planococcus sp. CAU13 TaxID=1541197 RepID=UPI0006899691|nr:N-acetylglucosamine-6-phosphate deacetylase [Planococcus sp. CAU13]
MTRLLVENIRLVQESGDLAAGSILIDGEKIAAVSTQPFAHYTGERFDGGGLVALPGFIDIHIHGALGADFMDADSTAAQTIAEALPAEGTTSFLATTMTGPSEGIAAAIGHCRNFMNKNGGDGAEMLGFHLEGPFIHPGQAGAQPAAYIREPSMPLLTDWFGETLDDLKIVTMAPELDPEFAVIRELANLGVIISAGHTMADYNTIKGAQAAGLSHLTHFGNAMRGLHHREIGVVGAGLLNRDLFCEVIADKVHLNSDMLEIVLRVIGTKRLLLITDSMRAKGLPDGSYLLGGRQVKVSGQEALLSTGKLAGSVLKMNEGLRHLQQLALISWPDAIALSSANAAKRLGVWHRKGSIDSGKDADIVLVTEKFGVRHTFCRGRKSNADVQNKGVPMD